MTHIDERPPGEAARLEALRKYQILDTEPEIAFDDLALLASHICETPMYRMHRRTSGCATIPRSPAIRTSASTPARRSMRAKGTPSARSASSIAGRGS